MIRQIVGKMRGLLRVSVPIVLDPTLAWRPKDTFSRLLPEQQRSLRLSDKIQLPERSRSSQVLSGLCAQSRFSRHGHHCEAEPHTGLGDFDIRKILQSDSRWGADGLCGS